MWCAHYTESTQDTLNYSQQWHKVTRSTLFVYCFMTGGGGHYTFRDWNLQVVSNFLLTSVLFPCR